MYWALIGVLPKDLFLDCQMPDYHKRIILSDACTFARCLDCQMPGYSTRCLHICQMPGYSTRCLHICQMPGLPDAWLPQMNQSIPIKTVL